MDHCHGRRGLGPFAKSPSKIIELQRKNIHERIPHKNKQNLIAGSPGSPIIQVGSKNLKYFQGQCALLVVGVQ